MTPVRGRARAVGLVAAAILAISGCLALEPSPTAPPSARSIAPSPSDPLAPRQPGVLVFAIDEEPQTFLPLGDDAATARVASLIYDPLYRLDARLQPRPTIAAGLPEVSADGLTWRVALRRDTRFHDRSVLDAADVVATLELARSPHCPFARTVCAGAAGMLTSAAADGAQSVVLTLARPWSPFLAGVLSRLAILPQDAVAREVERLMARAEALGDQPIALAERIAAATNAEVCLSDAPPASCDVAAYTVELERLLRSAGVDPPRAAGFRDATGALDGDAYAAALLERVQALARAVPATGVDRLAAALPLTALAERPIGSGPFALDEHVPAERIDLVRHSGHLPDRARSAGVSIRITADPAAAATALRAGAVDWLPVVSPEQVPDLEHDPRLRVVGHAEPMLRIILFNVRPGRVYDRPETRRAFALCIDKAGAAAEATIERAIVAWSPTAPYGWAAASTAPLRARDVAGARALLAEAGWAPGPDGVLRRGDQRLSSEIHVRPSRGDLLSFARTASQQLRECGIELVVRELDLTGDLLLSQLRHPNDFETVLISRELGVDPDDDLSAFESTRITTEDNPGDANAGGWSSPVADDLLERARASVDQGARAALYGELQQLLSEELPAYPVWYDTTYSGLSDRVRGPADDVDLSSPLHDAELPSWEVELP